MRRPWNPSEQSRIESAGEGMVSRLRLTGLHNAVAGKFEGNERDTLEEKGREGDV